MTRLRELKPLIAARYKAREIGLFGSFVHGKPDAQSDIDLLVESEDTGDTQSLTAWHAEAAEAHQEGLLGALCVPSGSNHCGH